MRYSIYLLIGLCLIACRKDEDGEPNITDNTLHYDGANQSAPILARGISYSVVKFPGSEIDQQGLAGKSLKEVAFHLTQRPDRLKLLVFGWNTANGSEPGGLLYEATLNTVDEGSWNEHRLSNPVLLPSEGIWIAFEIDAGDNELRVIGCDQGPRHPDGDGYGLFHEDDLPGWTNFFSFSNETVDINWNIRATVE